MQARCCRRQRRRVDQPLGLRPLAVTRHVRHHPARDHGRQVCHRLSRPVPVRSRCGQPRVDGSLGICLREGHEQQGVRPVLVVSPDAFNRVTQVPVVLPIAGGGNFVRTAGFAVSLDGCGTRTTGVIRCDQPRALDLRARSGSQLERVPSAIMEEVLARLATIFD